MGEDHENFDNIRFYVKKPNKFHDKNERRDQKLQN